MSPCPTYSGCIDQQHPRQVLDAGTDAQCLAAVFAVKRIDRLKEVKIAHRIEAHSKILVTEMQPFALHARIASKQAAIEVQVAVSFQQKLPAHRPGRYAVFGAKNNTFHPLEQRIAP